MENKKNNNDSHRKISQKGGLNNIKNLKERLTPEEYKDHFRKLGELGNKAKKLKKSTVADVSKKVSEWKLLD